MLTLVSRKVRKFTSAVVASAIVSFNLLAIDQGHLGPASESDFAGTVPAVAIATLPEVVVVAKRIDAQ